VIGQDRGVDIIRKAAKQKRNVLLIGQPGTGKSMLAQAMAELMPATDLVDILVFPNQADENSPKIKTVKAGEGSKIAEEEKLKSKLNAGSSGMGALLLIVVLAAALLFASQWLDKWMAAAMMIGVFLVGGAMIFGNTISRRVGFQTDAPKLIVDNAGKANAPFVDASGTRAGALLGDIRHDPLQSGGLGTPAHQRVEAGAIHRANKGVLFIDEIANLAPKSQQELLTAMQEKKYSITGQSEMSSGALTHTEPVPCDFVLVASGNLEVIQAMSPALRSRIRGYGYEVYLNDTMNDTPTNRSAIQQFVAQEVVKDGKIPHFSSDAVEAIITEARKKAGRKAKLTLKLRELGGLVRAAGDLAKEEGAALVKPGHVARALGVAATLEQQVSERFIEQKKDYRVFVTEGFRVGEVNGLAVMGDGSSGLIIPIVAEVAPAASKTEGRLIVTGKLGEIAKEAVENVSAIIKKHTGKDTSSYDIHVQFLQTYEGVEGDSASISVATAVISALEGIPVAQNVSMTGSLSVRGEVLPVGGITAKVEAAIAAGVRTVVIPETNKDDLFLSPENRKKVKIVTARNIGDVLAHSLVAGPKKNKLVREMTQ